MGAKHYQSARSMKLRFMGQDFESRDALARTYPKFAADDAFRAIKAGCETPFDVEVYCFNWRNRKRPRVPLAVAQAEYRSNEARFAKRAAQRRKAA